MHGRLKNRSSLTFAGVCLALGVCATAQALTIFRVAATEDDETYPCVSGSTVVWQSFNSRYGDWDVLGARVSNAAAMPSFAIGDFPNDDRFPIIDGNDVVWQHQYSQDGDGDVYGARVEGGRTVATFSVSDSPDDECLPWVSDGVAVWQHRFVGAPDWDVLGARLTGRDRAPAFPVSAAIDVNELFPCISGHLVVWQESAPDLPQPFVYGADISDPNRPRTFYTLMALGPEQIPSLSDGWLVGQETDGAGKVVVDNLYDPFNPEEIGSSTQTASPRIHQHIVVWQDRSNGTWDIRAYNLATRQELVITDLKMSDQVNPAVYVDQENRRATVVWQDNRDGNWDIYAAVLEGSEVAGGTDPQ